MKSKEELEMEWNAMISNPEGFKIKTIDGAIARLNSSILYLSAHPDNEAGSECADNVSNLKEILEFLNKAQASQQKLIGDLDSWIKECKTNVANFRRAGMPSTASTSDAMKAAYEIVKREINKIYKPNK